tara:strand:- start:257 stop:559 length:303 start_codon:yes stop_codon:yes gene_type:complete
VLEGKLDIAMMKLRIQTGQEDQSPGVDHTIAMPEFTLPDTSFLLYGTFSQDGFDLVITNPAADKIIVADYFSFNIPPETQSGCLGYQSYYRWRKCACGRC